MTDSREKLGLAAAEAVSRYEDIVALATDARHIGIRHLRVTLSPQMLTDEERPLVRSAFDTLGLSVLAHVDSTGMTPEALTEAVNGLQECGADALDVTLDPCLLLGERSRVTVTAVLKAAGSRAPLFISGPLTNTPARLSNLDAMGITETIAGCVSTVIERAALERMSNVFPPSRLRLLCASNIAPNDFEALLEGAPTCVYAPADMPRGILRLATGGHLKALCASGVCSPAISPRQGVYTVIGGAGFIGSNLCDNLLASGHAVRIVDNLARPGVEENLAWLSTNYATRVETALIDIAQSGAIDNALKNSIAVFHLAAQVAVTTSLERPVDDFEINARGTLNILEALRHRAPNAPLIFASTNKVYGCLDDIDVEPKHDAYTPTDAILARTGVNERRPLDLRTPYGCSKGAADQYVLDYAKSYGLRTAVLRMSCIYGPRQLGTEDQGWVAHFVKQAIRDEAITIYGDGMQVRDILHVNDAIDAYRLAFANIDHMKGRAFNLGGGPDNAVSLRQLLREIARILGSDPKVVFNDWRPGDQPYFVADTRAFQAQTGWRTRVEWREGLRDLARWLTGVRDASTATHDLHSRPRSARA